MCFTLSGRVQTRLVSLLGPLLVAGALALDSGDAAFLRMFALMAAVGLALDVAAYQWLIGYQARWLTLLLGIFELLAVARAAQLLGWPLDAGQMLALYAPAWLLAWLTVQVGLPLLWPRWAEDGGELLRGMAQR